MGGVAVISPHRSVIKHLAHLFSIRKEVPNGFKKFAYRNLERDDRHDQFLNDENLAHSAVKSKQYIRTQSCVICNMLTFVT